MTPPQITLDGKQYELGFDGQGVYDKAGNITYGYTVVGEYDEPASIAVVVTHDCLNNWTTMRQKFNVASVQVNEKVTSVLDAIFPYIQMPVGLAQIQALYPRHFLIILTVNEDRFDSEKAALFIPDSLDSEKLVQRMIYGQEMTDSVIEQRLLELLRDFRERDYATDKQRYALRKGEMPYEELLTGSHLPEGKMLAVLEGLEDEEKVKLRTTDQAIISAKISTAGLRSLSGSPKAQPVEAEVLSYNYVSQDIIDGFDAKSDSFNYNKLTGLLGELNDNYTRQKAYSAAMTLRAILDHIPPLLGQKTFDGVVSSYSWPETDKKYMKQLHDSRARTDDALHRPISATDHSITMEDIPHKRNIEQLLRECLSADTTKLHQSPSPKKPKLVTAPPAEISANPTLETLEDMQWSGNWNNQGSGFETVIKIDNYGRKGDYVTDIAMHATDGFDDPWRTRKFKFEGQPVGEALHIEPDKIITKRVFVSDDTERNRPMPDLDSNTISLVASFRSGATANHLFKAIQVHKVKTK